MEVKRAVWPQSIHVPPQFHQTQVAWGNLLLWNVLLLPRDDCFLTVVDGKLTAMDHRGFEVLEEDGWRQHKYAGETQADYDISYALLPTSSGTAWDPEVVENMAVRQTMKYGSNLTILLFSFFLLWSFSETLFKPYVVVVTSLI